MSETVNFIQGSKKNYDSSTMQGGVYFSKDSKEILLNGESYGNAVPADEEDLTSVNGALQLKDREVNADNFQSKGYVILRKNIVDGKNVLTQDMINQPNTIYEIRYDFDLNGEKITLQEKVCLKFKGGKLANGQLILNDTYLSGMVALLCDFDGTIANSELDLSYFIDSSLERYDCSTILQKLVDLGKSIYVPNGTFYVSKRITLGQSFFCHGSGFNSKVVFTNHNDSLFYYDTVKGVNRPITICIHDMSFSGTYPNYFSSEKTSEIDDNSTFLTVGKNTYTYYLNIHNCDIKQFRVGCDINEAFFCHIHNCLFTSLYDALVLRESNASSYTDNDFKFLFHTAITFLGRGDGVNEECTGNSITGNDFSSIGFASIWILSKFGHCLLSGNYFEKGKREESEDETTEIIVGDINQEYNLTYTPYLNSSIIYNSGLWAPRKLVLCNCQFSGNIVKANVTTIGTVEGTNNSGSCEDKKVTYLFKDVSVYNREYYGLLSKDSYLNEQIIDIDYFAIGPQSSIVITTLYKQYICPISFESTQKELTISYKNIVTGEYYNENGEQGQTPYQYKPLLASKYTPRTNDTQIIINNPTDSAIGAKIKIKYLVDDNV